jgi:hypothetical protein
MSYSWGAARNMDGDRPVAAPLRTTGSPAVIGRGGAGTAPAAGLEMRRLAVELAPMVGVWERLIAEHTPNHSGRCRMCTKGGTGLPSAPWPCSVYGIAEMARRRHISDTASPHVERLAFRSGDAALTT